MARKRSSAAADTARVWLLACMMLAQVALTTCLVGVVLAYGVPGYWPGTIAAGDSPSGLRIGEHKSNRWADETEALEPAISGKWFARVEHKDAVRLACIPLLMVETPVQAFDESTIRNRALLYQLRGLSVERKVVGQLEQFVAEQEFEALNESSEVADAVSSQASMVVEVVGQDWRRPKLEGIVGRPAILHLGPDACLARIQECLARQEQRRQTLRRVERILSGVERQQTESMQALLELPFSKDAARVVEAMGTEVAVTSRLEYAAELLEELRKRDAQNELGTACEAVSQRLQSELERSQTELESGRTVSRSELVGNSRDNFDALWQEYTELERRRVALELESRIRIEYQLADQMDVAYAGVEVPRDDSSAGVLNAGEDDLLAKHVDEAEAFRLRTDGEARIAVLDSMNPEGKSWQLTSRTLSLDGMHRLVQVNQLTVLGKLRLYASKWVDFFTLGGIDSSGGQGMFAALWGTVVLTLLMTVIVVPLGVVAAIYLQEYTAKGPLVSLLRISINNLAGVPSIVYGVFGVAFFCYTVGAFIDGGPENAGIVPLPLVTWYLLIGAMAFLASIAFLSSFYLVGRAGRISRWAPRLSLSLWMFSLLGLLFLAATCPIFPGFFSEQLPSPTFGKGGILWAAMTLALLTLPTVIVSTEESLAAVPNSLRVASAACGATRWQTIRRVVLPNSRYGVLTGATLAISRAIGQVAPLMLVGALPYAADLPLDSEFPYLHGSRGFKHLGYEIYNQGLRSEGAEQLRPDVFAAILLLFAVLVGLNLAASTLRRRGLFITQLGNTTRA